MLFFNFELNKTEEQFRENAYNHFLSLKRTEHMKKGLYFTGHKKMINGVYYQDDYTGSRSRNSAIFLGVIKEKSGKKYYKGIICTFPLIFFFVFIAYIIFNAINSFKEGDFTAVLSVVMIAGILYFIPTIIEIERECYKEISFVAGGE